MLAFLKLVADFSKGCAGRRIDPLLLATHPYHPGIGELLRPVSCLCSEVRHHR